MSLAVVPDRQKVKDTIAKMRESDDAYLSLGAEVWEGLTAAEKEQLCQLLHHGPVWDGSVFSKATRDQLIEYGLATRCCFRGEQGYTAATYLAYTVHKKGGGPVWPTKPGIVG